jgi:DNA-binding PadR family transcriptional regulator
MAEQTRDKQTTRLHPEGKCKLATSRKRRENGKRKTYAVTNIGDSLVRIMEDLFKERMELEIQRMFEKIIRSEAIMTDWNNKTKHSHNIDAG